MYTEYIKHFLLPLVLSSAIIPGLIIVSRKLDIYDRIDTRKIHNGKISNIGGLAILLSFLTISMTILPYHNFKFNIYIYLLAAIFAFLIGFIDDIKPYSGKIKLLLQFICAGFALSSGIMSGKINLLGIASIESGLFTAGISIFIIVLFMNAVNLIDGMDGIATGILLTANVFLCILGFLSGNPAMILLSLIICGAISGFFIFNYPPAKIFLGDGGAYFLGFIFATVPMYAEQSSGLSAMSFIIPLILMILPVADLIYVAGGRIKNGRSIFHADKTHLHHRLMRLGLSNKSILFLFTGFTAICGFILLLIYRSDVFSRMALLSSILLVTITFYLLLKNSERRMKDFNKPAQNKEIALPEACTLDR